MSQTAPHKFPKWAPQVGVAFFALTVVFLMALVFAGVVFEKQMPENFRFLVVAILALTMSVGGVFIGGNAVAEGKLKLPGASEHPMSYTLTGGVAVFALLLLLGMQVSAPTTDTGTDPSGGGPGVPPEEDTDTAGSSAGSRSSVAPTYATITLAAGFAPDPFTRAVHAGGRDAVDLGGACRGYVHAAAPDVDLNYQAGQYPLAIYASAQADVTLIVYGPDGQWYCDDDSYGTNPAVLFGAPMSGTYHIWLGTFAQPVGGLPEAVLYISEMPPQW